MDKRLFILVGFMFFGGYGFTQPQYKFIDFKNVQRPAIVYDIPYPEKTVDGAVADKFSKMGYKGKESKGFTLYRNVSTQELGPGNYDLYIAMDKRSRKDKDVTTVTMLMSRGNENFVSDSADAQLIANGKKFLENLVTGTTAYDLEQQILAQAEVIKKEERRLKNYGDEADDMQKRKRKLEQQIIQNQKDQDAEVKEIERQKQVYETLKTRRIH